MKYPCLVIDLAKLRHNIEEIKALCGRHGIEVVGVIKGFHGIPECTREFERAGLSYIASSRLEQLAAVKEAGFRTPTMAIRVSMISEVDEVVRLAECSLQSDETVLSALNGAAARQGKIHDVILMTDLGDLREGFWTTEDLVRAALRTENEFSHLRLLGVATNLGCYGSVEATEEKMKLLVERAEAVERAVGHRLRYISGGSTTSIPRLLDDTMPPRVNLLRIGEAILVARDLPDFYKVRTDFLHQDAFTLRAEVIEVKTKPSYPVGNLMIDAFRRKNTYKDCGIRKRALIAVGKVDYGDPFDLSPRDRGITVVGASSDHTILDVEDAERDVKVGDVLEFTLCYGPCVYLTHSPNVGVYFTGE